MPWYRASLTPLSAGLSLSLTYCTCCMAAGSHGYTGLTHGAGVRRSPLHGNVM
jgi:hypothetical protein